MKRGLGRTAADRSTRSPPRTRARARSFSLVRGLRHSRAVVTSTTAVVAHVVHRDSRNVAYFVEAPPDLLRDLLRIALDVRATGPRAACGTHRALASDDIGSGALGTITGAVVGVQGPGTETKNSTFWDVDACIWTGIGGSRMSANADILQNYCRSDAFGIAISGPVSGTPVTIERNYVRAVTGGIVAGGQAEVEKNIIDAGSPLLSITSPATKEKNLCDDDTLCPDPDSNFTLNVDFTPQ